MKSIPRNIDEPPIDTPMLEWWANEYDRVFIILSPFFRVEGFSPDTAAFGPMRMDSATVEDVLDLIENPVTRSNEAPVDFEDVIKQGGEIITWQEVRSAIGVEDHKTFCLACWLWVVASSRANKYPDIVGKLQTYCRKNGIYKPEEDQLPAVLEPVVGTYLTALGIGDVTVYSEFRDVHMTVPVTAFSSEQPTIAIPREKTCAILAHEPKVLFCWCHDETYGFICISEDARLLADPADFFEGQYAGVDTYCDWLNPIDFFERKPASKIT